MNHPFSVSVAAWATALALTLSACSRHEDVAATPAQPVTASTAAASTAPGANPANPPPQSAPAEASQAEASPQEKLNLYIECYNHADSSFRRSLARYQSWVKNMDTGPTGHELVVYGLYSVSGAQACQKAIEQANAASPKMPQLEQAASSYAASLGPLEGTINETNIYYDRENYKDDGFAKGKALHKTLAEQAKVFVAASQRFSATLDDANDALQQAHLQQMEKEGGRNLAYYHLSTMIQAKELVRLLMQNNADPAKIGARIDTFEKTIDDMEKAPGDKPMMWIGYQNDVDNFRKAAKELYRRQRDKTPYNIGEQSLLGGSGGWMVEGSPDKLLNTYNTMVETSNHLGN